MSYYDQDDRWSRLSVPSTSSIRNSPSIMGSSDSIDGDVDHHLSPMNESPIRCKDWTPAQLSTYIIASFIPHTNTSSAYFSDPDVYDVSAWVIAEKLGGKAFFNLAEEDVQELPIAGGWKDILHRVWKDLHLIPMYDGEHGHPIGNIRDPGFWSTRTPQSSQQQPGTWYTIQDIRTAPSLPDSHPFSFGFSPLVRDEDSLAGSPLSHSTTSVSQTPETVLRSVIITAPPPPHLTLAPTLSPASTTKTRSILESIKANSSDKEDDESTIQSTRPSTPRLADQPSPVITGSRGPDVATTVSGRFEVNTPQYGSRATEVTPYSLHHSETNSIAGTIQFHRDMITGDGREPDPEIPITSELAHTLEPNTTATDDVPPSKPEPTTSNELSSRKPEIANLNEAVPLLKSSPKMITTNTSSHTYEVTQAPSVLGPFPRVQGGESNFEHTTPINMTSPILETSPPPEAPSLTGSLLHVTGSANLELTPANTHRLSESNVAELNSLSSSLSSSGCVDSSLNSHRENDGQTDLLERMLAETINEDGDAESVVSRAPTATSSWPTSTEMAPIADHAGVMRVDTERMEAILQNSLNHITTLTERIEGLEGRLTEMEVTLNTNTKEDVVESSETSVSTSDMFQRPPVFLRAGALVVGLSLLMGASHLARRGVI